MKEDKSIYVTMTIKPLEVNRQLGIPDYGFIAGDTAKKTGYLFLQFSSEEDFNNAIDTIKPHIGTILE